RRDRKTQRGHLALTGRKIDRAVVHGGGERLVNHVDDELAVALDVARGILRAAIALVLQSQHDQWRVFGKDVEEAERRRVDRAIGIERGYERNGTWNHNPAKQLVAIVRTE